MLIDRLLSQTPLFFVYAQTSRTENDDVQSRPLIRTSERGMSSETTDLNLALSVKHFSFTEPDTTVPIQEKLQGRDRCWTNALDKFLNVFITNAYTKDIPQAIEDTILSIYQKYL